jgi:threonine synthase
MWSGGILEVIYNYKYLRKQVSREAFFKNRDYFIWRYSLFLPVKKESQRTPLRAGWTPLYQPTRLMAELGLNKLFIKDERIKPNCFIKGSGLGHSRG